MQAGTLRHRIEIERPVSEDGEYGRGTGPPVWKKVATLWAHVRQVTAREVTAAQQPGTEIAYVVELRHTDLVAGDRRLRWLGQELYVLGLIDPDGRRRTLHVMCGKRDPANGQ